MGKGKLLGQTYDRLLEAYRDDVQKKVGFVGSVGIYVLLAVVGISGLVWSCGKGILNLFSCFELTGLLGFAGI